MQSPTTSTSTSTSMPTPASTPTHSSATEAPHVADTILSAIKDGDAARLSAVLLTGVSTTANVSMVDDCLARLAESITSRPVSDDEMTKLLTQYYQPPKTIWHISNPPLIHLAHHAINTGFNPTAMMKLLVQHGADVNCRASDGDTALAILIRSECRCPMEPIVEQGVEHPELPVPMSLNHYTTNAIDYLLSVGADVSILLHGHCVETILHWLVRQNTNSAALRLNRLGTLTPVQLETHNRGTYRTALAEAVIENNLAAVVILLKMGANPRVQIENQPGTSNSRYLLDYARQPQDPDNIVRPLILQCLRTAEGRDSIHPDEFYNPRNYNLISNVQGDY